LSVLYICPIKALLNNLESRLRAYGALVGRRVDLWHGDVGASRRRAIMRERPDLLLTTPESMEVMLVSSRSEPGALFRDLQAVVVDELHAFAGDDRGWHLLAVLERVRRLAGREIQRLGLSATIGNPEALLEWLAPAPNRPRRVIAAAGEGASSACAHLDYVGSVRNAAKVVAALHRGEKRLVFCDSRTRVEALAAELRQAGTETFVSHSSLGLDERRRSEAAFSQSHDCVIVATSTLELGIDVGDLDRVVQIDAPATVASFLQRLGRTGRRPGAVRNCLFLATSDDGFLRASGLLRLWHDGYVEPIVPPPEPFHIFAQQLLALALQEGRIGRATWREWLDDGRDRGRLFVEHLRRFPAAPTAAGALYWLGRLREEEGRPLEAQSYYRAVTDAFPHYYYGVLAGKRLAGNAVAAPQEVVNRLPKPRQLASVPTSETRAFLDVGGLLAALGFADDAALELHRVDYRKADSHLAGVELARLHTSREEHFRALRAMKRYAFGYLRMPFEALDLESWHYLFPIGWEERLRTRSERHRLDPYLVAALIRQESEFNAGARSHAGALGLMQIMPQTGRELARQLKIRRFEKNMLLSPSVNIEMGTKYMKFLMNRFQDNHALVTGAYNGGPGRMSRWVKERGLADLDEFIEDIAINETRRHIKKVLDSYYVYRRLYPSETNLRESQVPRANNTDDDKMSEE